LPAKYKLVPKRGEFGYVSHIETFSLTIKVTC